MYGYEFIVTAGIGNEVTAAAVAAAKLAREYPELSVIEATCYDGGQGVGLLVQSEVEIDYDEAMDRMESLETMEEVHMEAA
jgi:hypothetical protein